MERKSSQLAGLGAEQKGRHGVRRKYIPFLGRAKALRLTSVSQSSLCYIYAAQFIALCLRQGLNLVQTVLKLAT